MHDEPTVNRPEQPRVEAISGTVVEQEEEVIYIYDVEPADSFLFDEERNAKYEMLKEVMTQYFVVYTTYY